MEVSPLRLEVRNLSKSFGEKRVLEDISFACRSGAATGLLGRNGAGKTTAIRTLLGIIIRDGGEVLLDGAPLPAYYNPIGYLPEERGMYPKLKIEEQLLYFASLRGLQNREGKKSLDYWLERLGMEEYRGKTFETLSKGNQQKIQLISALLHDPSLVILDEPFSGLDPVNAQILKSVVLELIKKDKLIIFSSHQMNFVEEFCQDVILINKGGIVLQGNLTEIKRGYERKKLFVRLRRSDRDITAILQADGVEKVKRSAEGYLLTLQNEDVCPAVMSRICENSLDIDDFHLVELSLNDIFIEKVGVEQ